MARQILNTLYVMTPNSYLHLENDTVRVDVEHKKKLQVPLHHLGSVVCLGNIMISPALMHRCADEGISLVLLNGHGRFKARLEGAVSGNILLRCAQHQQAANSVFALESARAFIAGKIRNSRYVLQRGARDANEHEDAQTLRAAAEHLAASLRAAAVVTDLDALRGVEGEAAKTYFEAMSALVRRDVRTAFAMNGRSRRPPRDRFNALISFLYSIQRWKLLASILNWVSFMLFVRGGRHLPLTSWKNSALSSPTG